MHNLLNNDNVIKPTSSGEEAGLERANEVSPNGAYSGNKNLGDEQACGV